MKKYIIILLLLVGCVKDPCASYVTVYNETAEGMAVDINGNYIGDVCSFCTRTFEVSNGVTYIVLSSEKGFVALQKEVVQLNCEEYYVKFNY